MQKINPHDFIQITENSGPVPVKIDLVYTDADHRDNIFKTAIYKPDAKLWTHPDLFQITMRAAEICYRKCGHYFEIKDSLRPAEAQKKMNDTDIVQANPHWIGEMLARPGEGGHPRGMAIDIILIDQNGREVDMGTRFDYFSEDPTTNPSARANQNFPDNILQNRKNLEEAMLQAAQEFNIALLPLPSEWWDFRFMPDYSGQFQPLSDRDLPDHMKLVF